MPESKKTFEQLLKELEDIVKDLESKDITLEDAMTKYQDGLKLAKESYQLLEQAHALVVKNVDEDKTKWFNALQNQKNVFRRIRMLSLRNEEFFS